MRRKMRRKRGRTQTEWRQGRGFAVGAPARRSRDGNGKTSAPVGPMTGQPGFAAGEMRPNGSKSRGGNGSRVWEKRKVPRFRGADYGICRWRYFLSVKKVTKERRVFAVGAPARRSRDGNGKIAVRGGEAMAAKRTTAQGGFAQRNAARDFARQTQKAGPVTGQPGFAAGEMRPNGSKGRGESGSRVWEKRKAPAFAGPITSLRRPTFLALRK